MAIKQFKNSIGRVAGGLILREHPKATEMIIAEILQMEAGSQEIQVRLLSNLKQRYPKILIPRHLLKDGQTPAGFK